MQLFYNYGGGCGESDTGWAIENDGVHAGVQCMDDYGIKGESVRDLINPCHDGNIKIDSYADGEEIEPTLKKTHG